MILILWYGNYCWQKALISCEDDIIVCLKRMKGEFLPMAVNVFLFTFLFSAVIGTSLLTSRWNWVIGIGSVIYLYDMLSKCKGFSWEDHKAANALFAKVFFGFEFICFLYWYCMYRLYKKFGFKVIWFLFAKGLLIYYILFYRMISSCDLWYTGLGGDVLDRNVGLC